MKPGQELQTAISRRHPDTICLGNTCYVRLDGGNLAKVELASSRGDYDVLHLTFLNRQTGPVDSLTLHFWDLPSGVKKPAPADESETPWDIYRPTLDIDAFSEAVEAYLHVFQESDTEKR